MVDFDVIGRDGVGRTELCFEDGGDENLQVFQRLEEFGMVQDEVTGETAIGFEPVVVDSDPSRAGIARRYLVRNSWSGFVAKSAYVP